MIGPVVRHLRQERRLSQEELAANARVSSGYLSKLERGVYKSPSSEVLGRIADALQITPVELYRAAGLEHLIGRDDPGLEPLLESLETRAGDLPKRDRDIIANELRLIFVAEKEAGA